MSNTDFSTSYDDKHALIIGISKYEKAGPLENAENDAKGIKDVLVSKYDYKEENITLLLNESATKDNIMDEYCKYFDGTGKNDSLIVYYAGHGNTKLGIDGNQGFLIPYDGTEENWNTLISWDELRDKAQLIKAKHIFFIFDACYSGLALNRALTSGNTRFLNDIMKRGVRQVLTAGMFDQTVNDGKGPLPDHSIFTGYVIKALEGEAADENGILTANLVMPYVYRKVGNNTYTRQTPCYGSVWGDGDFVFSTGNDSEDGDIKKNDDKMIQIPSPFDEGAVRVNNDYIETLKELVTDNRNKIKVNELVNGQIQIVLKRLEKHMKIYVKHDEGRFYKKVKSINGEINSIIKTIIILVYYGQEDYINIVTRTIEKFAPVGYCDGCKEDVKVRYYPCLLMFYVAIMTSIESRNYDILRKIINITKRLKNYSSMESDNLLSVISYEMCTISSAFQNINEKKNYKYPFSEYVYELIQPLMDDELFLGKEDYKNLFCNCEIIVSLWNSIEKYNKNSDYTWCIQGRFCYVLNESSISEFDIRKLEIYPVIEELEIFDSLGDKKEEFIDKYNKLIEMYWF